MKIRSLASVLLLLACSLCLVSCGNKGEAKVDASSHGEVAEGVVTIVSTMMTEMASVKNLDAAEALAEKFPSWKAQMKGYLTAAKGLPEPSPEEKAQFTTGMDQAKREAGPAMMAMMMGMSQNADGKAIGEIIETVRNDEEMNQTIEAIEAIYGN